MDPKAMRRTAPAIAEFMKVLSNETRLMILCLLVEGERSVNDLADTLGVRGPTMSQQLALLRKDGLVKTRREGQTIHYSLARDDIRALMGFLHDSYCGSGRKRGGGRRVA